MPPITEAKLYEAFGLTPPQEQGAQGQAVAEPAAEGTPTEPVEGAQAQEPAEPATGEVQPEQPEEIPSDGQQVPAEQDTQSGKPPLSEEQRRANAARRRQQEQQAAIDAAVRSEQAKHAAALTDLFAKAGLKNTFTGEPITTMEQFTAWNQQFEEQKLQSELKSGKLTVDSLNRVVSQHPVVQQAQQILTQSQAQQQAQQQMADRARIDQELAEINKFDPTIKTVADLLNMPTSSQFKTYVGKGLSFLEAFKLSNMESITAAQTQAVKQEAMNNARGKDHLKATGNTRGSGAASVPPQQMAIFRQMNPGASDAEIQKFYNNYLSRKGG